MTDAVNTIKTAVALRAHEFGADLGPEDILVDLAGSDVAPGCRLFRAFWGAGRTRGALAGLLRDDDPPDTYPGQAIVKVFQRWLATAGHLPGPVVVAEAVSYLLDPIERRTVLRTREEITTYVTRPDWQSRVSVPAAVATGVSFWWADDFGVSRLTAFMDAAGELHIEEKAVQAAVDDGGDGK